MDVGPGPQRRRFESTNRASEDRAFWNEYQATTDVYEANWRTATGKRAAAGNKKQSVPSSDKTRLKKTIGVRMRR